MDYSENLVLRNLLCPKAGTVHHSPMENTASPTKSRGFKGAEKNGKTSHRAQMVLA
jgi:hypothetical protein